MLCFHPIQVDRKQSSLLKLAFPNTASPPLKIDSIESVRQSSTLSCHSGFEKQPFRSFRNNAQFSVTYFPDRSRSFVKRLAKNTKNTKPKTNSQSAVRLNNASRSMGSLVKSTGTKNTAKKAVMKMVAETYSVRRIKNHNGSTKSDAHTSENNDMAI